jgi:hypothetical protein
MANQPWFKLFAGDYLLDDDVQELTPEAEALLIRMWCICHRAGSCPTEAIALALKIGRPVEYVARCLPEVNPFFEERDGRLFSPRMEREKERSEIYRKNALQNPKLKSKSKPESNPKSESESEISSANYPAISSADSKATPPTLAEVSQYCRV